MYCIVYNVQELGKRKCYPLDGYCAVNNLRINIVNTSRDL